MAVGKHSLGLVGAGKVGTALAVGLHRAGVALTAVLDTDEASARHCAALCPPTVALATPQDVLLEASAVLLAVPDPALEDAAKQLASWGGTGWKGKTVLQTSGRLTSSALAHLGVRGAEVASFHPVQSFPTWEQGLANLPGSYFACEGSGAALKVCVELASRLECSVVVIPAATKPLHHAACCMASSSVAIVVGEASRLMAQAGAEPGKALKVLLPLAAGTLQSLTALGLPQGLTGPLPRQDADAIREHLEAINALDPNLAELYRKLNLCGAEMLGKSDDVSEALEPPVEKPREGVPGKEEPPQT
jgi:predicted short-subunit dehydrogenase-like oxidoreductase (DUF2520 family)